MQILKWIYRCFFDIITSFGDCIHNFVTKLECYKFMCKIQTKMLTLSKSACQSKSQCQLHYILCECQSSHCCTWMVCVQIFRLTQQISATSVLSSFPLRLLQWGIVDINTILTEHLFCRSYVKMCGTAGAPNWREGNTCL